MLFQFRVFLLFLLYTGTNRLVAQILDINFSEVTSLELEEFNYYSFRGESNHTLYLSTQLGSDYNGSEVFNNGALGPNEYLLFSPTDLSSNQWFLYDYLDPSKNISIQINPYERTGPVHPDDLSTGDEFGYKALINDFNQTVVGAPGDDSHRGAVYIFERNSSGELTQVEKIVPQLLVGEANRTKFGASMDGFSAELFIGAPDSNNFTGKVYHYRRNDDNFTFLSSIEDNNGSLDQQFGYDLNVNEAGDELVVSSPHIKNAGVGKVTIYTFDGVNWNQSQQLWANSDRNISADSFGYDLAMSSKYLVVGAPNGNKDETSSGLVYVFEKNDTGYWNENPSILSPNFFSDDDQFGHRVEINDNLIFIGSKNGDDDNRSDVGLVYVFELIDGLWQEEVVIAPPNHELNQVFSHDIAVKDEFLVIGVTGISETGTAYLYKMESNSSNWNLISTLENSEVNKTSPSLFSLDIHNGSIVLGVPEDNSGQELGGSIQGFYNLSWQSSRVQKFPPMFDRNSPETFSFDEDILGGFAFDLNGTHPFDSNFTWYVSDYNSSTGSFDINSSSGEFIFYPLQDFNGIIDFNITLSVAEGSVTRDFSFVVSPVPDPPVFLNQSENLPYGMVSDSYSVEINATDVDGDILSFTSVPSLPAGLSFNGSRIEGTPLPSAVGDNNFVDYSLSIEINDGNLSDFKTFNLRIYKKNTPPMFTDLSGDEINSISIQIDEDFTQNVWKDKMPTLVLTDVDPSNTGFSLSVETSPSNGNVFLDPNATDGNFISYESALNFYGNDQFTVRLTDSGTPSRYSLLDFSIQILAVNDAPIISSSPILEISEGLEYQYVLEVYDPDLNDSFSLFANQMPSWLSLNSDTRTISGTPQWYDYKASPDFVSIWVVDSVGAVGVQEFGVSVIPNNYPPIISLGSEIKVVIDEDENPRAWNDFELIVTDVDTDISLLEWRISGYPLHGQVTLHEEANSIYEFVNYKPDGNFTGTDFFTLEVVDSSDPNRKTQITFEVIIESVEDAPTFSPYARYTDAVIGYEWKYKFTALDGDVGQVVTVLETSSLPDWLSLRTFTEGNVTIGELYGVPNFEHLGMHELELRVEDDLGSGREQTIVVDVLHGNFLPEILEGDEISIEMIEDTTWYQENPLTIIEDDNQAITWGLSLNASNGIVEINATEDGVLRSLMYLPDGNFSGQDSFQLYVSDGIAEDYFTYLFNIPNINDVPLIYNQDLILSIKEGEEYHFDVRFNDGDGIETTLMNISNNLPSWITMDSSDYSSGKINVSFLPQEADEGDFNTTLTISDLESNDSLTIDVNVYVLNYAPRVNHDVIEVFMKEDDISSWSKQDNLSVLESIEVTDVETLSGFNWEIYNPPANGTATIGDTFSSLSYLPKKDFSGEDSFIVSVSDTGANGDAVKSDFITVNVIIQQIDDPPTFISDPISSSNRSEKVSWNDESEYFYHIRTFDADWPFYGGPSLQLETVLPSWLEYFPEANGSGFLTGKPGISDEGIYRIGFSVVDSNGSSVKQDFNLHVIIDDYPPRFESVFNKFELKTVNLTIKEDEVISSWVNPKSFGAVNPDPEEDDNEEIAWSIGSVSMVGGNLEISGEGDRPSQFNYMPPKDFHGVDEFSLIMDEGDRSSELNFKITVEPVPDKPEFITSFDQLITLEEGVEFQKLIEAFDPDGETVTFQLISPVWDLDPWASVIENDADGKFYITGTPKVGSEGNSFPYRVLAIDDTGRFDQLALNFFVEGVNQPPTISLGHEVTIFFNDNGDPFNFEIDDLLAYDPEGEELFWSIPTSGFPEKGIAEIVGNGISPESLKYYPESIDVVDDQFVIRVSDGVKSDDLIVNAIMIWESESPVISHPTEIEVFEGDAFYEEINIGFENSLEAFTLSLSGEPSWVHFEQLSNTKAQIYGEAPKGSFGNYTAQIKVDGKRTPEESVTIEIKVASRAHPTIELLGEKLVRISSQQSYLEPGYMVKDSEGKTIEREAVVSVPDSYDSLGFKDIKYELMDANSTDQLTFRKIKKYEEAPLKMNSSYVTFQDGDFVAFDWSKKNYINFLSTGDSANNGSDTHIDWLKSKPLELLNHNLKSQFWGEGLEILSFSELPDESTLLAGSFSKNLSFNFEDRSISSSNERTGFLLKLNKEDKLEWVKTFGGDVKFKSFKVAVNSNSQIVLSGIFSGSFRIEDIGKELESSSEAEAAFTLIFNSSGVVEKGTQYQSYPNILKLVGMHFHGSNTYLVLDLLSENINENKGILIKLDESFEVVDQFVLESSEEFKVNDSCFISGVLFLGGFFRGDLSAGSNVINQNIQGGGFVLGIDCSASMELTFARFFQSTLGCSVENICDDYWGDIFVGLKFDGKISLFGELTTSGKDDLVLAKLDSTSGDLLWIKQIGGEGDEYFCGLKTNSVGALAMVFGTEFGLESDSLFLPSNEDGDGVHLCTFSSDLGAPVLETQAIEINYDHSFFHKINVIHPIDVYFEVLHSPEWITLLPPDDSTESAYFYIQPDADSYNDVLNGEFIEVRAFNLEGDFTDQIINLTLTNSPQTSLLFGQLPELDSDFIDPLNGGGEVVEFKKVRDGWVFAINEVSNLSFLERDTQFSRNNSSQILFYIESNNSLSNLELQSSNQVTITDALINVNHRHYFCGNFRENVFVNGQTYGSRGGCDFFILVLDEEGEFIEFETYGGLHDDLVHSLFLKGDTLLVGGDFAHFTNLGDQNFESNGTSDCFLLSLQAGNIENVNWVESFGGDGPDIFSSVAVTESGKIFTCSTHKGTVPENTSSSQPKDLISNLQLRRLNEKGELEEEVFLTSSSRLRDGNILWSQSRQKLFLIGEFEGVFNLGENNVQESRGGFDIFVSKLDSNFDVENLVSIGSTWNDRLIHSELDSHNSILLACGFYEQITVSTKLLTTNGGSDSFISRFDIDSFEFRDAYQPNPDSEDRIDSIFVESISDIYFAGETREFLRQDSETLIREDIQVARLFTKSVTPKITSYIPEEIPCARKFNFSLETNFWSSDSNEFSISGLEEESLFNWLDIYTDSSAQIFLTGIAPASNTDIPLVFELISNSGEKIDVNLVLNFRSNTEKYPIIVLPESPEVFQFEESKVSISIYNVDKSSLVTIEAPEWIDLLQVGNLNNYQINFFPREGHLGNHQIFIVTASTEGVVYRKPLNFKVVPRIVSESNSLPVIEKGWLDSWFGRIFTSVNGWNYHFKLGWVFISAKEDGAELWFWHPELEWVWTNEKLWQNDHGSYIFSANNNNWLMIKEDLLYDFTDNIWRKLIF